MNATKGKNNDSCGRAHNTLALALVYNLFVLLQQLLLAFYSDYHACIIIISFFSGSSSFAPLVFILPSVPVWQEQQS